MAARRFLFVMVCALALSSPAVAGESGSASALVERGRYLVEVAGCNDCHTAGYADAAGEVPEREWLKGSPLGFRGPWGTTYASNLRLYMADMTQTQWLAEARTLETRPPMPWFNVRAMSTRDLRAIYRYIRDLGPDGKPVPEFVPPEREPDGPYVQWPMPSGTQ